MTQKRVVIRQLPTGVPGLDAVLGGGIPEYSFNLVAGEPGAEPELSILIPVYDEPDEAVRTIRSVAGGANTGGGLPVAAGLAPRRRGQHVPDAAPGERRRAGVRDAAAGELVSEAAGDGLPVPPVPVVAEVSGLDPGDADPAAVAEGARMVAASALAVAAAVATPPRRNPECPKPNARRPIS